LQLIGRARYHCQRQKEKKRYFHYIKFYIKVSCLSIKICSKISFII